MCSINLPYVKSESVKLSSITKDLLRPILKGTSETDFSHRALKSLLFFLMASPSCQQLVESAWRTQIVNVTSYCSSTGRVLQILSYCTRSLPAFNANPARILVFSS